MATWQTTLPERSRYAIMQASRQMLDAAVRWGDMSCNPAKLVGANPPPPRGVQTFTLAEIEKIGVELGHARRRRHEALREELGIGAGGCQGSGDAVRGKLGRLRRVFGPRVGRGEGNTFR